MFLPEGLSIGDRVERRGAQPKTIHVSSENPPISQFTMVPDPSTLQNYVYHQIGQSNADGRGYRPSARYNKYGMCLPDGSLVSESNTVQSFEDRYGAEVLLAEIWPVANAKLLKTAQGGITAQYFINNLLQTHLDKMASVESTTEGYQHVMLWVHGESDSFNHIASEDYESQELLIFDAITEVAPNIQIFSILLNSGLPSGYLIAEDAVNQAKIRNSDSRSNVHTIINDFTLGADQVHYEAQGIQEMVTAFLRKLAIVEASRSAR